MNNIYIKCIEDLDKLRNLKQGQGYLVYLCNDLDFSEPSDFRNKDYAKGKFIPIAIYSNQIIFNGCGNTIKNMEIGDGSIVTPDDAGLFNTYGESNICLKNISIVDAYVCGFSNSGIVGGVFNGTINNSYFSGMVFSYGNKGVLVGKSNNSLCVNGCVIDAEETLSIACDAANYKGRKNIINGQEENVYIKKLTR